jgi:hypothetical protein
MFTPARFSAHLSNSWNIMLCLLFEEKSSPSKDIIPLFLKRFGLFIIILSIFFINNYILAQYMDFFIIICSFILNENETFFLV